MPRHELNGAKIALSCSGLVHVRRGVEAWSEEAFHGLRALGLDVTLFQGSGANGQVRVVRCVRRDSPLSRRLLGLLPRWGWRVGFGSAYQMEQTTFALGLFGALRARFDLLHTKDPQVALLFHRAHKAGLSRAAVILNHGTEEPPGFLKHFDYVQHLAPFHREEAIRQGVAIRRHFVVPNFVDTEKFSPGSGARLRQALGIPPEAFVVLCVAAVKRHHKRIDWLLDEVARVPAQAGAPVHLLVVGASTGQTEPLVRRGRELLGARVRFLIDHPRERMPEVYRAADVFVLCSLKEMLANASLEALASGLPVLMHREPVGAWAIGEGGQTLDMTREGELASALATYRNAGVRAAAGRRARTHAVAQFSKEVVLAQQLAMYRDILSDSRR
jgi:glycosyltransferase involved in cell wall biosynthesis